MQVLMPGPRGDTRWIDAYSRLYEEYCDLCTDLRHFNVAAPGQEEREKRGFQKSLKVGGNYKKIHLQPRERSENF